MQVRILIYLCLDNIHQNSSTLILIRLVLQGEWKKIYTIQHIKMLFLSVNKFFNLRKYQSTSITC